jgi:hypothetical protein
VSRLATILLVVLVALATGCGGDDDNDGASGGTTGGSDAGKAATYNRAIAEMKQDEYDAAIPAMEELGDFRDAPQKVEGFRDEAARETLANARRKLEKAPRAALSLAQAAQRYKDTPAGRALVEEAERAHAEFKRKGLDDLDQGK